MILIPLIGMALGIAIASVIPFKIPIIYAKYTALAILATLDAIFGGLRAQVEGDFIISRFLASFFINSGLAAALAYLGDVLGIDIYLGAVVAFSIRIFNNLSLTREMIFNRERFRG